MARTYATEEHVTSAVTSCNSRRAAISSVTKRSINRGTVFSVDPLRGYITRQTELSIVSGVSAVQWRGASWLLRGLLRCSPCEPLLLEAGN
jgi:hypothetical protein